MFSGAPEEIRLAGALILATGLAYLVTPLARGLAIRTGFLDHPAGYKEHSRSTPYLGGTAVMAAALIAWVTFGAPGGDYFPLLGCAVALWAVGTIDDRHQLGVPARFIIQVGAGATLWAGGLGWEMLPGDAANLTLSILWVVGITNAFNLMDNLDGATATVAAVSSAGVAILALLQGAPVLAVLALAVCGACVGFLPHNLAKPSRIFLGDGGSMPLGVLVAGAIMAVPDGALDWALLLASAPLAGLPILDTTLVVVSRRRRGAPVLSGARDHLTHRLLTVVGTERRVAAVLAVSQALLCALALAMHQLDAAAVGIVALAYLAVGIAIIVLLEDVPLAPKREERSA